MKTETLITLGIGLAGAFYVATTLAIKVAPLFAKLSALAILAQ